MWWMPAIRKTASGKVTRIPEDRRTPKYLNCQVAPGPLLEGGLESYRAHMPAIFQSSPGHHVFASILPAAALLASLLWDHPLLCQCRCWRLAWWQTAGGRRRYRSCLCLSGEGRQLSSLGQGQKRGEDARKPAPAPPCWRDKRVNVPSPSLVFLDPLIWVEFLNFQGPSVCVTSE